ncbi:MAG TPA: glycosyltransferase family 4 protein [Thermoleophilia bacterium]|nr:glycosyltransferase family 4 protein [Thermoleophilia bacterium]HVN12621.1 glycosyltransferase family 4 protein [Kineosporiaceae bacterium]
MPSSRRRLHLVVLVRSFGFPEGMAATNRVRLLGRALSEQDVEVSVVCMRVSERPGEVRNVAVCGLADGIAFRYATGSTTRSDSFIGRRLREARGYLSTVLELVTRRRRGTLDCVYLASLPETWRPGVWVLLRLLRRIGVPVVVELNELPSEASWLPESLSRRFSHLDGAAAAVAISAWLRDWVDREAIRIDHPVDVIEVPIVVDTAGTPPASPQADPPMLVYSASDEYGRAVTFILRALHTVWQTHPDCRLTITGMRPATVASLLAAEGLSQTDARVHAVGWIDRDRLLRLYGEAAALLIPLFDDLRSEARFPTKVGEYLASGRPVVTTAVGEIERYFTDRETACISRPGDPAGFADSLLALLGDPDLATRIGAAGRRLAEERFAYSRQGPRLRAFLDQVCAGSKAASPAPATTGTRRP